MQHKLHFASVIGSQALAILQHGHGQATAPRRNANCASFVMASHSSKMMSLNLLLRTGHFTLIAVLAQCSASPRSIRRHDGSIDCHDAGCT